MKHIKSIITVIIILTTKLVLAQNTRLTVSVLQNDTEIIGAKQVYSVYPQEFTLAFNVENSDGFLIGATFDADVYRSALGMADLEVMWFANTGMAEELFNSEQQLFISNEAPSYWYFENNSDHRFDKSPTGTAQKWSATRSINNFNLIDIEKKIEVKDFTKSLYLVFYENVYDVDYVIVANKIRNAIEIRFKDQK